jgi:hypothetical protein
MHFFIGSMAHVLGWTGHDSPVPALAIDFGGADLAHVRESLVRFCIAGVQAPRTEDAP